MTDKHDSGRSVGKHGATCRRTSGEPCGGRPVPGTVPPVCSSHLPNPKARAKAAVRAELSAWRVTDDRVDPGEQLLRLVSQSARRAALYSLLLEQAFEQARVAHDTMEAEDVAAALGGDPAASQVSWEDRLRLPQGYPAGTGALIGVVLGSSETRGLYAKSEELRGLVRLEAEERDRCARFAKLALDAGIAERLVRIQEDQAAQVVAMIRRVLLALGLSPTDPRVSEVVVRELRALEAA